MSRKKKDSSKEVEIERASQGSLKNWGDQPEHFKNELDPQNVAVKCGWGRLIFGQTYAEPSVLAEEIQQEADSKRDVAIYVREPHVVLAAAPQALFLDPSHTFRLQLEKLDEIEGSKGKPSSKPADDFRIRPAEAGDERPVNRVYRSWSMVPVEHNSFAPGKLHNAVRFLVAEEIEKSGESHVVGVVMGVDHTEAFGDPDNGSSLWALAVDPQVRRPGVGRDLIFALSSMFRDAGRSFMDLSVMHDNAEAIALYHKLGFEQIPVYSVKRKNPINETLFVGPTEDSKLNIYARIIVDEAKRRGILVDIEDAEAGLFKLSHGGRSISCRESLSDLTTAVAMSRCDDKRVTQRLLRRAGLRVPAQRVVTGVDDEVTEFVKRYKRVVVKPARGEQGGGVAVDLTDLDDVEAAIKSARTHSEHVIIEEFINGQDLRVIVIDGEVVAAAIRRPPVVRGDGKHAIKDLIEKLSRRREAASDGESSIPMDDETIRCVKAAGYKMDDVLPEGETLAARKTANLHTGGTIHDVTDALHLSLVTASIEAARVLEMPVVGLDLMVRDPEQPTYAIIEANERPGLANHEPQPTAERFIDLLFPHTRPASAASHNPGIGEQRRRA